MTTNENSKVDSGATSRHSGARPQVASSAQVKKSPVIYLSTFNKSCESCGLKKRKCDGAHPCRRCIGNGEGHLCSYSKRRARTPRNCNSSNSTSTATGRGEADVVQASTAAKSASLGDACWRGWLRTFKRCRLSASPATGLVGMQENAYLSDFFGCIGFLPLTSRSQIRETIVIMMTAPGWCGDDNSEIACPGAETTLMSRVSRGSVLGRIGLEMGPSMCIFWCACALGALVTGSPKESVEDYYRMAKAALDPSTSPPSAEVARAWTSLAYVNGFIGNMVGFQGYLQRAEAFVRECTQNGREDVLPAGFAEIVKSGNNAKAYTGNLDVRVLREEVAPAAPEMSEFPTEGELFRVCFMVSRRLLAPALFSIVDEQSAFSKRLANEGMGESWSSANRLMATADAGGECDKNRHSHRMTKRERTGVRSMALDALATKFKNSWSTFQRLEEAAERRPSVRNGFGGLMINKTLAIVKAVTRDHHGVLESTRRSVEVVERYPGLFHFVMGLHDAHLFAALVATIDDPKARQIYDRVKALFNGTRPPGWRPIPPFEEWNGVSACCNHIHCRSMGIVLDMCSPPPHETPATPELRGAPKWTRFTHPAPAQSQEHRDSIGESVKAVAGDYTARSVIRATPWVSRARPAENDPAMGKTEGLPPTFAGYPRATCGKAKKYTSGSNIRTSRPPEAASPSGCEKCRLIAKSSPDSSTIGAEDWLECAHAMQTALVPNASPVAVASRGLCKQHHNDVSTAEYTIAAEDWSDVACALLHPSS